LILLKSTDSRSSSLDTRTVRTASVAQELALRTATETRKKKAVSDIADQK